MFKFGHDLPEFALFTLLDKPAAMAELRGMYERYLDVAARHGFVALMGGLDYRASPDWGGKLGYSASALSDAQLRAIEFLRDVARPYRPQLPGILYVGIVGPRGDAYAADLPLSLSFTLDSASLAAEPEAHGACLTGARAGD